MSAYIARSSGDDWSTPPDIYGRFASLGYHDQCPLGGSGGLDSPWRGRAFVNPPYSRAAEWADKAIGEVASGNAERVVLLLAARTDARWFRRLVDAGASVYFLTGRLSFGAGRGKAPFPSCLVVLGDPGRTVRWVDRADEVPA